MDSNPSCRTRISSCSYYCSKPRANSSSDCAYQIIKNKLTSICYSSSAEVKMTKSSEATNKTKEAVQW